MRDPMARTLSDFVADSASGKFYFLASTDGITNNIWAAGRLECKDSMVP